MNKAVVRLIQNQGKEINLHCQRDTNNEIIRIFDLDGNVLPFNQRTRCVTWKAEVWYY